MRFCKSYMSNLNTVINLWLVFDSAGQQYFGFKLHKPHALYILKLKMRLLGTKHPIEK